VKTKAQALRGLGLVVAEFAGVLVAQTPEDAARRAWRPDGPSIETLTAKCAALQQKLAA
jgi:hypothetical protein